MGIVKIKHLADLNSEHKSLSDNLISIIRGKKSEILALSKEEFSSFFLNQGFAISNKNEDTIATYNNFTITLLQSKPHEAFMGAYCIMDVIFSGNKKQHYKVLILEPNQTSLISRYNHSDIHTTKDQLDLEIESIMEKIDHLKSRIEELPKKKLLFKYFDNNVNVNIRKYSTEFLSFSELLTSIFDQN